MKIKKLIPKFAVNIYHFFLALAGAFLYGFPAKKMVVIGITGTKGKSTTVMLAGRIFEEAGFKVGWISSATIKIGEKEWLNPYHMTMPGRLTIQRLMAQMVKEKCRYCLLEVTSEGISQYRHKFINFDTAVFLNLKPEHIEAHGSFEKYREAKGRLLAATKKTHIFNLDDENVGYFLKFSAKEKLGYSFGSRKENIKTLTAENLKTAPNISFQIERVFFNLGLIGGFNAYNALAAILIGASQGVKLEICKKALEKIKTMPGRMEVVAERPFKVIVDLAHTPDSFEEVFRAVKNMPHNKIISVFGAAGGGRDKWKRPVLGKIAAQHSDFIILTNEDPYDESPADIIKQIAAGIEDISINQHSNQHKSAVLKILDRREAIRAGLKMAGENDIVLILGKGTEQLMVIGGKKIPWDDRNVVREELGRR